MPEHPDVMSVDAKIEHHIFSELVTILDVAGTKDIALYDPEREIVIDRVYFEQVAPTDGAGAATVIGIGTEAATGKYATINIGVSIAAHTMTEGTVLAAGKAIPAGTRVVASWSQSGGEAGTGYVHVFYYRKSNKPTVTRSAGA